MRGVVFCGDCTVELATVPDPTPGPGEVVLEIKASGMCGSDLHVYRRARDISSAGVIRGHEPCGVVVAVGPGTVGAHAHVGAPVMVHHYHGCAGCEQCRSGWPQMCQSVPVTVYGEDAHGAHAPFMKVRADTLVPLDERLSFAAGAAISCGTGTAWGAFERMGLTGRDTVAIFGQGPVGLSATLLAKAQGARVIALDIDDERLATSRRAAPTSSSIHVALTCRRSFGTSRAGEALVWCWKPPGRLRQGRTPSAPRANGERSALSASVLRSLLRSLKSSVANSAS